ncbi:MAG: NUDIX domain-containing protein [Verrucomicrobium sp.]|nr:NUDIX domain-containing protein [Verrucomicrobium sp.]
MNQGPFKHLILAGSGLLHDGQGFGAACRERGLILSLLDGADPREAVPRLLSERGLDPAETLLVGDTRRAIEAARHGGVTSCALLTGAEPLEQLKEAAPDLLFRDLDQLLVHLGHRPTPPPPLPAVGALLYNGRGEVLMIQTFKWSHHWGIPGGKIQGGETAEAAVIREVREETGLELEKVRFARIHDCINPPEFYHPAHFILLTYTARVAGEDPSVRLNEEADCFRWIRPDEALGLPLNGPSRTLLEHVRSHPHLGFAA